MKRENGNEKNMIKTGKEKMEMKKHDKKNEKRKWKGKNMIKKCKKKCKKNVKKNSRKIENSPKIGKFKFSSGFFIFFLHFLSFCLQGC